MRLLLTTALIGSMAVPAFAGSLSDPIVEPVPAAPVVFAPATRNWTGPYVGAQLGYGEIDVSGGTANDRDGVLGGVHAGYDYDFGNFVLGVVGDYNFADADIADGTSMARLRARAGAKVGTSGLLYGTGGAAFATAEIGGVDYSDTGYVIGVGYEHMVTDNVSVGGEVLYHQVDDFDNTGLDVNGTSVQAKVSFRF